MSKTIFMMHGLWGGAWCWDNYRKFFEARGYECITPTLRLHDVDPSAAPHPDLGGISILDYARDMEEEIRSLNVRPILMGHSLGGLLAQMLASRGLGEAAVLITPAAPRGINGIKFSAIRSILSVFTKWGFWRKPYRQTFNEAVYSLMHMIDPVAQRENYNRFCLESGRALSEIGFWLFDPAKASRVEASRVTAPVLVVGAAQDRITPASVVRKVAHRYRTVSTYREYDNHAHWIMDEPGWQDVAQDVALWLEKTLKG